MAYTALITKDEIGFENNANTITTVEIAEMMEVEHKEILKKLEGTRKPDGSVKQIGIIPVLTRGNFPLSDYFALSTYKDSSGKENKCYNVTRLGCDFLANKFTGEKGILFTAKYVKRFNEMERGQVPKDFPSALRAYADEVERRQIAEQENEKLQQELDYSKDWYSIKRVAAMNGVDWKTFNWRKLKEKSIELGYGVKKIFDANYGEVNTYHRDVWEAAYPEYEI
jgi:phage regulator Rha-like protein